jgi:hypothetical protein
MSNNFINQISISNQSDRRPSSNPEHGGNVFLLSVGDGLSHYTTAHSRSLQSHRCEKSKSQALKLVWKLTNFPPIEPEGSQFAIKHDSNQINLSSNLITSFPKTNLKQRLNVSNDGSNKHDYYFGPLERLQSSTDRDWPLLTGPVE